MSPAGKERLLVYGVTGFTGALVSARAAASGLPHLRAARSTRLFRSPIPRGCEGRVVALDDPFTLDAALADVAVVLNCAAPLSRTRPPLLDACLRTRTHYLDLAAEVSDVQAVAARSGEAAEAGVMLLPGVGFGVVPTDCLAAHLSARLPGATELRLAVRTDGGTLGTLLHDLPGPWVVRRNGALVPARAEDLRWKVPGEEGPPSALLHARRGDLVTAPHTTGIPTVATYVVLPPALAWLAGTGTGRRVVERGMGGGLPGRLARLLPGGRSERARTRGAIAVHGEARAPDGRRAAARLTGPDARDVTADAAARVAARVLDGAVRPGFRTPAELLGGDFVLELDGVARTEV